MIRVKNINKNYGKKPVLADINVSIPSGQVTSLIGPNGAGKSTLLMMIAKLLDADSGEIWLGNRQICDIKTAQYAKCVAILRQSNKLDLRLTVEELVSFGRFPYSRGTLTKEDWQIVNEAFDFLGIEELRHSYLDEISGGQRQMAFLAMTIAQQTEVLLLDEPLNNLDMTHCVHIMQALRRLCDEHGRTVILVIHDINFAINYSDYIVALKEASIKFEGAVDGVITEANLSELYELDFKISRFVNDDNAVNKPNSNEPSGLLCNYFIQKKEVAKHVK